MNALIIIPARLASTRLPRKLLLAETGWPLIQHTYEAARESLECAGPIIASGDPELTRECGQFAPVIRTGQHPNGTSRMAEAVKNLADVGRQYDIFVNVQADEPEIDAKSIDLVVKELADNPDWDCATACYIGKPEERQNRNRVKVSIGHDQAAQDFSRARTSLPMVHIGVYAYRAEALRRYAAAGPCEREQAESLEQLRALHIGLRMGVVFTDHRHAGINTAEDYAAFVARQKAREACAS